jgi:hypothetical protein
MEPALLLDPVTITNTTGENINPSSEESILLLRRILRVLESNSIVDNKQRQRVTVEAIGNSSASASTEIAATLPVTVASAVGTTGSTVQNGSPTIGTPVYQAVWEGPVDQRWRIIDAARTAFAVGVRPNLVFT